MKHREQSGSCWTTSTTTCFKSAWSIAFGNLLTLSEQQLVNCITVDSACNGELTNNGFVFAVKNAMCTEVSQPRAIARLRIATLSSLREVSRGTEAYPTTASRLSCRQWHNDGGSVEGSKSDQAILVGGGWAEMSTANTELENDGSVVLLDNSSFSGGNSTVAIDGIDGEDTGTQRE